MSNLDNTGFNNEIANTPVGVPPDQFTFETISDLEIPADLEAFDEAVDILDVQGQMGAQCPGRRYFTP